MKQEIQNFPAVSMSRKQGDDGSVLLLFAFFLIALFTIAAVAIDVTISVATRADMRLSASHVALASLQAYNRSTYTNVLAKLEAARSRAEQLAQVNVSISKPFLLDPNQTTEIGTNITSGNHGEIVPGIWHFVEPTPACSAPSANNCPCGEDGRWHAPCFEEVNLDAPSPPEPNAFRADLKLSDTAPLRTLFAVVAGRQDIHLSATATAAIVPRRGVFLVDLSRSSVKETHLPYEENPAGLASEYAFRLTGNCPLACPAAKMAACVATANPGPCLRRAVNCNCTFSTSSGIFGGFEDAVYNNRVITSYVSSPLARPVEAGNCRNGAQSDVTKHFPTDYQCQAVTYQDGTQPSVTESYLIDEFRGAATGGATYDGPEPLMSVLAGVHHALELFRDRGVSGDEVGFIGFDQSSNINIREQSLTEPKASNADFAALLAKTDISNVQAQLDSFLFPRVGAQTNLPSALSKALSWITAGSGAIVSHDFVTLFSDGITDCSAALGCGSEGIDVRASLNESMGILDEYVQHGVRFHAFLLGGDVLPHTLLQSSNEGDAGSKQCMTDTEARSLQPPADFVNACPSTGPCYGDMTDDELNTAFASAQQSTSNFFLWPNILYNKVRETRGVWSPIRPCCQVGGACSDVRATLAAACKDGSPLDDGSIASFVDSQGRLMCDPNGRTRRVQIQSGIDEVLSLDPYVLVE